MGWFSRKPKASCPKCGTLVKSEVLERNRQIHDRVARNLAFLGIQQPFERSYDSAIIWTGVFSWPWNKGAFVHDSACACCGTTYSSWDRWPPKPKEA